MPSFRLHRLLVAGTIIAPATLFAVAALHSHSEVLHEGQDSVVRTTAVLNEHALKILETADLAIGRVDDHIDDFTPEQITSPATSRFLARLTAPLGQANSIWISDARGALRAGSQAWDPSTSIAERDFFRVQRERDAGTYISVAFMGKITRTPSFAVSRRHSTSDGHFEGVIYILISPEYFAQFFADAAPPLTHVAALMRSDGEILAREPYREVNSRLTADSLLMRQISQQTRDSFYSGASPTDGIERIYAYHKVGDYPVYVAFGIETAAILRRWHENLFLYGAAAGAAALTLLLLSGLIVRGARAERALTVRLRGTLDELAHQTAQREAAEQRMREGQKMEAVGQLTGGIAHDFNNLLMAVLGSLELLHKRLPPGNEAARRLLDHAVKAAERGTALTQRLLAFGRRQVLNPKPVDLPILVSDMAELLRTSVGTGIDVETRFAAGLAPALVDANQLELALLNLTTNARDAMTGNGCLTITAREEPVGSDEAGGAADGYVVLSVTDTGTGMDEATLARATEPFFTTKAIGAGTGLGLSMVHGLAAQSGGKLVLHSAPGMGTMAELWLPRTKPVAPLPTLPVTNVVQLSTRSVRHRTVLVVDDNPLVVATTAAMLEDLGHATLKAVSAREALEIMHMSVQVDLVLTDYLMPGMTGLELATELRRLWPDLPLLLATGYAERAEVIKSGLRVLSKPFNQAILAEAIGDA